MLAPRTLWVPCKLQIFQLVLWLAPNAWSISRSYAWYGRFVAICGILRWSSINLVSSPLPMDVYLCPCRHGLMHICWQGRP